MVAACGTDSVVPTGPTGDDDGVVEAQVPDHPAYVEHIAPVLQRSCAGCHGAATAITEPQNCFRSDRWDSAPDSSGLCNDSAVSGVIFGVGEAGPLIVDNVVTRRMPKAGAPLSANELELFRRWGADGYPKRAVDRPPTIQFMTPPAAGATVCQDSCSYELSYVVQDPDGDSVRWSLGWSGNGASGVFVAGLTGGTGTVTIDASLLASGTYTVTAMLDDGTTQVMGAAPGALTVPAGHDAPPPATVSFAQQIQPILNASCTASQCHGANQAEGLALGAATSYAALVSVAAKESPCTGFALVAPGEPDLSYLMFKLQGAGACMAGSQMPRGRAPLSAAQLQLVRDWIAGGAPNN